MRGVSDHGIRHKQLESRWGRYGGGEGLPIHLRRAQNRFKAGGQKVRGVSDHGIRHKQLESRWGRYGGGEGLPIHLRRAQNRFKAGGQKVRGVVWVVCILVLLCGGIGTSHSSTRVHKDGLTICAIIINELTKGRVDLNRGKELSLAIANAGNKHFGKVTCGDMWLLMAIVYVESGFRENVINHLNCRGMFQVHAPSWARKFGIRYKDLLDPHINADSGVRVLKYYLKLYRKLEPALSAYNSDNPVAAKRYVRTVLATRNKISKRYAQLYRHFRENIDKASKSEVSY